MLTFRFDGADGRMTVDEKLTVGMAGKKVRLEFSPEWNGLSKTAVFTAGQVVRDVVVLDDAVTIPADVTRQPLERLWVGVYGVSRNGTVVIPTVRALGPVICPGVDPSGDDSAGEADLPVWGQLQAAVDEMREDLDAVGSGGYYVPSVIQPDENTIRMAFAPTGADMPIVDPVIITLPGGGQTADGKDGGYYRIAVDQPTADMIRFRFTASDSGMETLSPQTVTLPAGPQGVQGPAGAAGLAVYYTPENVPDGMEETEYDLGQIASGGRAVQTGDLIVNTYGELFQVSAVDERFAAATLLGSLRGPAGSVGKSGYTPVRGTDYWTESDKAEIKAYVDEAILEGAW